MAYSEEEKAGKFQEVCKRISLGESLTSVLKPENQIMGLELFYSIIHEDAIKAKEYARACEARAELIFEDIITISDESNADLIITEKGGLTVDGEAVSRSRLKIDARKWVLSKMNPKKYGDKIETEHSGSIGVFDIKKALGFDKD